MQIHGLNDWIVVISQFSLQNLQGAYATTTFQMFIFLKLYYLLIPSFTYVCVQICTCQGSHVNVCVCRHAHATDPMWTTGDNSWELVFSCHLVGSGNWLRSSGLCANTPARWTIPPQDLLREISAGVWRWQLPGSLVICTLSLYLQEAHRQSVSWGLYTRNSLIMRRASFHNWGIRVSLSPLTPIRKEAIPQGGAPWRSL